MITDYCSNLGLLIQLDGKMLMELCRLNSCKDKVTLTI
jgi:hypothetical protein